MRYDHLQDISVSMDISVSTKKVVWQYLLGAMCAICQAHGILVVYARA